MTYLMSVLTFLVWMSYNLCTESLICLLLALVSTMKTCKENVTTQGGDDYFRTRLFSQQQNIPCDVARITFVLMNCPKTYQSIVILNLLHGRLCSERELDSLEAVKLLSWRSTAAKLRLRHMLQKLYKRMIKLLDPV